MSEWCRHGNDWKDLNFFKHWVTTLFLTWLKGVTQIKWKCTHFQSRGGLWTLQQKLSAAAGQTTQHSIQHGAVNSPAVWWIWMGKGIHNHKSCAPLVTSNGWPCAKNHRSNFGCSSFIWCWNPKQCIVWQSLVSLLDVLAVSSDIDSNSNWPWPHSCSVVFWVHLCVQCILQFTLAHCKDWWCILMGNSQGSWHPFNCESQCNQWDSNGAHCVTMVVPWKAWKQQTSSLSWHWNETKQEEFEQLLWCWHGFGKSSQTTAVAAPCKQFVASHQLNHPLLCLQHMLWCHFFSCCCRTLMLHTKKVIQHSHPAALWALICQPSTVICLMLEEVFSLLGAILSVQAAAASVCCCFSLLLKHKSLLSSSEKAKSDKTWQCGTSEHTLGDKAAMAVPVARVAATMSNGFLETLEATTTLALPWLAKPNKKEKMDHESPLQDDKVNDPTLPKTLLSSGSSIMVLVLWHSCLTDDHGVSTSVASTSKQVFSMSLPPVVLHSKLDAWNRLISVSASSSTSTWSIVMIWLSWIIVAFVMASHWHLQMVNKAMTAIMMQLARMVGIKTLSLRKLLETFGCHFSSISTLARSPGDGLWSKTLLTHMSSCEPWFCTLPQCDKAASAWVKMSAITSSTWLFLSWTAFSSASGKLFVAHWTVMMEGSKGMSLPSVPLALLFFALIDQFNPSTKSTSMSKANTVSVVLTFWWQATNSFCWVSWEFEPVGPRLLSLWNWCDNKESVQILRNTDAWKNVIGVALCIILLSEHIWQKLETDWGIQHGNGKALHWAQPDG